MLYNSVQSVLKRISLSLSLSLSLFEKASFDKCPFRRKQTCLPRSFFPTSVSVGLSIDLPLFISVDSSCTRLEMSVAGQRERFSVTEKERGVEWKGGRQYIHSCFRTRQHSWTSHEHNESVPTWDDTEGCWQPYCCWCFVFLENRPLNEQAALFHDKTCGCLAGD